MGITPAWWAIRNRNKAGFQWLLEHGAEPNPDVETITVLEMAASYPDPGFMEIALRFKPNVDLAGRATLERPLQTAAAWDRYPQFMMLLKAGATLERSKDYDPMSNMIALARNRYVYEMLLAGADPFRVIETGPNAGKNSLIWGLENRLINPDLDEYIWREKVIRLLQQKGLEVSRPSRESPRKKPMPADLEKWPGK